MRSPFPGLDPFIESQEWEDFHARLNTVIADFLSSRVEPAYFVRVERRVYVEHAGEDEGHRRADIAVMFAENSEHLASLSVANASTAVAPVECELPMPEERRETYLIIRERESMQVVTVLETLFPANKRGGGDGRREYLEKREQILESNSHLVELDLLRGGQRLPTIRPLPAGDYYAIVSRAKRRPKAVVYPWSIRAALPPIPIPLKVGDDDVTLDLQTAFATVYDRARYDLSIDYQRPLDPPLSDDDAKWMADLFAARSADES